MSYKYHAKSIVYNEKNLIRVWDIAFDGYNGGGGCDNVTWIKDSDRQKKFLNATRNLGEPYDGPSMMVMGLPKADLNDLPSPLIFGDKDGTTKFLIDPEHVFTYGENNLDEHSLKTIYKAAYNTNATNEADKLRLNKYYDLMPNFGQLHTFRKPAGLATSSNVSQPPAMAFPGQMRVLDANGHLLQETSGSGHLGPSYVGVASVREGKGFKNTGMPTIQRII